MDNYYFFMVVLPLNFMYKQNIFDAIITVSIENSATGSRNQTRTTVMEENNKKDEMNYRQIYDNVVQLVGHSVSYRDFQAHIDKMVNDHILYKDDPTGKRGSTVHYSLTEKGERTYRLKILGTDKAVRKRKNLYQLLLSFQEFKKTDLRTERELGRFLRQIGYSRKDLKEIRTSNWGFPKSTIYEPIKGVKIVKWVQSRPSQNSMLLYYNSWIYS